MNDRTCIVTRRQTEPDELIRFVVGPDGAVVPDLKRNLPGRGCWVTADREHVDKAAKKGLFDQGLQGRGRPCRRRSRRHGRQASLAKSALGALGLARKAGVVALGATKVEASVRSGAALLVLHAAEASEDGRARSPRRGARPPTWEAPRSAPTNFFRTGNGFGIGRYKCDTCSRSCGRCRAGG